MSLSSHLAASSSPVSEWMGEHFPETRQLARLANPKMKAAAGGQCVLPPGPGVDSSLTGTALNYFLCAFSGQAFGESAAWVNEMFDDSGLEVPANEACAVTIEEINTSDIEDLGRLIRLCVVLARFEQVRRSGNEMVVFNYLLVPIEKFNGDPGQLGQDLANKETIQDLELVANALVEDYADLRDARSVVVGPIFDQSRALGGADGDLIYDGTLVDFKSSKKSTIVNRRDTWQMVGYLLSDSSDQFGIENVEIGALRWRVREKWDAEEFLDLLSGSRGQTLSEWRSAFAEMTQELEVAQEDRDED